MGNQINKPNTYFNPVLYTGNGSTQSITNVNFQPDFTWVKERGGANSHMLADSVRGATKILFSNLTNAEDTDANSITSFDSDGFGVGSSGNVNASGDTYVGWNWKAGGTAVSNTDGSITSSVSANTDAGFSVVSYTATSGTSSIGHGLNSTPSMIILKAIDQTSGWVTGLSVLGWDKYLSLQSTNAFTTDDRMFSPSGGTDPTSTLFWSNQSAIGNAGTMVAYCFADKAGFSRMGSYVGNGNADGTFVYTGFKPAFIIIKPSSKVEGWTLIDNKRLGYNPDNNYVYPNENYAEMTNDRLDIVSNGFKIRSSTGEINTSGATMIFMCFAENPLVGTNGVPATAR